MAIAGKSPDQESDAQTTVKIPIMDKIKLTFDQLESLLTGK